MAVKTNNTYLDIDNDIAVSDERETMIKVDHVGMTFNMASEQLNNLKEYFISIVKHNLFFKELRALDDISFEIKKGDVFGIVGTNGSGKSTLLKILAGVLDPSEGDVEINGNIAPLIELGAGFDMDLSARENIYLNGALLGYSKEFITEHFDSIVEFSEVKNFLDMPMKNYSSGMVARIAFAIATVMVPEILIVDEVLSVGDFMFQKKCEDRILDLIEHHNTTVLIVSHSNDQIARLCNRCIWIEKGKTRMIGSADKVCDVYGLVGGRAGSLEAESTILSAAKSIPCQDASDTTFNISSSSFADAGLTLAKRAGQENIECVCLANTLTHLSCAVGNSIAGALDAPLLPIDAEKIDQFTLDWICEKKPSKIVILNHGNSPGPHAWATQNFDWNPEVLEIKSDLNVAEFCMHAIDAMNDNGIILLDPIIAYVDDVVDMDIILAKRSYSKKQPIIAVGDDDLKDPDKLVEWLKKKSVKNLMLCKNANLDNLEKTLLANSIEAEILFSDIEKSGDYAAKIQELIKDAKTDEVIIASEQPTNFAALTSAGYYCHGKNCECLIVDDTSLDSIAQGVKFIQNNNVKRATLLQGSGGLSFATTNLLARLAKSNS